MNKLLAALLCCAFAPAAHAADRIAAGKALTEKLTCFTCHGKDFNSPTDPTIPRLGGQHKDYLVHALTAYKRADGPNGRNNASMTPMAKMLSDKDIEDVAAYLHSLPTKLVTER